jgi:hypothetical protein
VEEGEVEEESLERKWDVEFEEEDEAEVEDELEVELELGDVE